MSTEAERIAQYQRGFNDCMSGRSRDQFAGIFYMFGWKDAAAGRAARLK
jgi:ribosome modulation factor